MITEKLIAIQQGLKAPKGQYNEFGKYKYRSCEDILEAVKPLLAANKVALTITDEIVEVGARIYVKATAVLFADGETVTVTAYAREEENKKGMDGSQVTGAASSYARKYALNGLFCIDDTKDADATNTHGADDIRKQEGIHVDTLKAPKKATEKPQETLYPIEDVGPFCADCGVEITPAEKKYSEKYFNRPLCRECQKNAR